MKTKIVVIVQIAILVLIGIGLFLFYPRTDVKVDGDFVNFNSINAKVIMISENPDFSNPRYILLNETKNLSLNLKPGTYYYKSDNGLIEGIKNKFTIKSKVGLAVNKTENESNLVNVGNVRISVRKNENGVLIGKVILEPEESEKIDNNKTYVGGQYD